MTREEHIQWCKKRALEEMNYTQNPKDGIISMMSDLRKHLETNNEVLQQLCVITMMGNPSRQEVIAFINGFN